jgi:hypothetical protein
MEGRERISYFIGVRLFASRNATVIVSLIVSALWVAGAIFPRGSWSWARRTYLEHLNFRSGWL